MRFQAPRGTNDVLPSESHRWIELEGCFRELARLYGYAEIRTPDFEDTELFVRSSGETSDVVSKEMYTFPDKSGRSLTLKPEATAPTIRAVVQHSLCPPGTVSRLSYISPIFRYDRPQKGRYRQSHQVGLELLGGASAEADAEVIEVTFRFYERLGIEGAAVRLNSLGREECRAAFRQAILDHARTFLAAESDEARAKAEKNPLRLLDSKDEDVRQAMAGAPPVTRFLEDDSRKRLDSIQALLTEAGIPFTLDPGVVRGLDYYTETVFEVHSTRLGAQSALCGGGRYDHLVKELGGPPTPAVGVAMGIERALLVLEEVGKSLPAPAIDVYLAQATPDAAPALRKLARELRRSGLATVLDTEGRSLKAQIGQADRLGARYAAILGDEELGRGVAQLRDLRRGEQVEVPLDAVATRLRSMG
ncbi:MAG: histidine--tRNA ligase [Fimbriimonas ginsengisoli]|uniref:Histidine--tRNA ligase n=1 Tax=Fimbriimonas ginsengisoli TaxID=1005039 RepID=A0A931PWM7_FIMGI|nr:histidine--tRNA ligase [Fimbriimonas ginsengisoli]MBI3721903.1 histidine--tRNA ligase [Fimbriimonas ginsengisoli]